MNIKTQDEVLARGLELVGYDADGQAHVKRDTLVQRYRSHFGPNPRVHAILWSVLQSTEIAGAELAETERTDKLFNMFLMTMYYLKTYNLESEVASRFGIHEQTVRKWTAFFINKIAPLIAEYVVWPDQWDTTFIISVDCVNFAVNEPQHPILHKQKTYFDPKNGKAGLT